MMDARTRLWVGLGNPGAAYAAHRHNVGFMAVDRIAQAFAFDPWRARFSGLFAEGRIGAEKLMLLKPQTFMNESGQAVRRAVDFFKLMPADVTVFYDELDLAPGRVKVKTGGGAAGHNGIRSITAHIGPDFHRVRIGIGHPGHKDRVLGHVLSEFAKTDREWVGDTLDAVAAEVPWLVASDAARFMSEVARRTGDES
jgi:PTH1 family peptidyl-tRNA hydrolase